MFNCRKHKKEELSFLLVPTGEQFLNEYGEIEYKFEIADATCYECMKEEHNLQ